MIASAGTARLARLTMVVLLVGSAALFTISAPVERSGGGDTHSTATEAAATSAHDEGAEASKGSSHDEGSEARERAERSGGGTAQETGTGEERRVLGVNPESTPILAVAVLGMLLLAAAIAWRPSRALIGAAALVALLFAVLDGVEISHQISENRAGVAVLAGLILMLHAGATAAGVVALAPPAPQDGFISPGRS